MSNKKSNKKQNTNANKKSAAKKTNDSIESNKIVTSGIKAAENLKQNRTVKIVLAAVIATLAVVIFLVFVFPLSVLVNETSQIIIPSYNSGYYENGVDIEFSIRHKMLFGEKIYYTLDGSDPTEESDVYENPIKIKANEGESTICVIKTKVSFLWMSSKIQTFTYVVGENIAETYGMNIISLSSDYENLYDYQKGIFVSGQVYDENVEDGVEGFIQGNYSMRTDEWIKDSHITMIGTDGNVVLDQNIGLTVSGGTSAAFEVKSLKIIADEIYDVNNPKFEISLYNDEASDLSQFLLSNNFRLRSGSQDFTDGANVRSSLMNKLAKESNFDGYAGSNRTIVLINGKFYGIFDMQYNYSNSYLKNRYSLLDSLAIEKFKGNETGRFEITGVKKYFEADLSVEANRAALEQRVDMDNFLMYYAINVLVNNTDWPANNYEMWRYKGGYDGSNKYTDGRYRFLIYDTDLIYMTPKNTPFFEGFDADIFVALMDNLYRGEGSQFAHVMESKYYRDKFVTIVTDLLNTSFDTDNVNAIIDEEYEKISKASSYFLGDDYMTKSQNYKVLMHEAATKRESEIKNDFSKYFGLSDIYELTIKNNDGIALNWNNMSFYGSADYTNNYYKGVEFTISADAYPMYNFDGFIVNGKEYSGNELTITDDMIVDGRVNIETLSSHKQGECLVIEEAYISKLNGWIKIKNIGTTDVDISKYYLTDKEKILTLYNLPSAVLKPNEDIVITSLYVQGENVCNFEFARGVNVMLTDGEKICDSITIPRMGENETYKRYEDSNRFVFVKLNATDIIQ